MTVVIRAITKVAMMLVMMMATMMMIVTEIKYPLPPSFYQVEGRFPSKERRATFHLFSERLPAATTAIWRWMRAKMLPSPSKFHYTFNMRELSRVFQVRIQIPIGSSASLGALAYTYIRHEPKQFDKIG